MKKTIQTIFAAIDDQGNTAGLGQGDGLAAVRDAWKRHPSAKLAAARYVMITLRGGSAEDAKAAACVDLDLGVRGGGESMALMHEDRVPRLLSETGAEETFREGWDGSRFGDGNGGPVEWTGAAIEGTGLYEPGL